jgi:hypothetical protein
MKWNELRQTAPAATLQSGSCPQALWWWCVEKNRIFFFSYSVFLFFFYSLILLLLELLQRLLTTWLQAQKHTRVCNPDAHLQTHVQGKQVYVGLHHMVQILYCNQNLCVCVLLIPKVNSKTSFGAARSFFPRKFRN